MFRSIQGQFVEFILPREWKFAITAAWRAFQGEGGRGRAREGERRGTRSFRFSLARFRAPKIPPSPSPFNACRAGYRCNDHISISNNRKFKHTVDSRD